MRKRTGWKDGAELKPQFDFTFEKWGGAFVLIDLVDLERICKWLKAMGIVIREKDKHVLNRKTTRAKG